MGQCPNLKPITTFYSIRLPKSSGSFVKSDTLFRKKASIPNNFLNSSIIPSKYMTPAYLMDLPKPRLFKSLLSNRWQKIQTSSLSRLYWLFLRLIKIFWEASMINHLHLISRKHHRPNKQKKSRLNWNKFFPPINPKRSARLQSRSKKEMLAIITNKPKSKPFKENLRKKGDKWNYWRPKSNWADDNTSQAKILRERKRKRIENETQLFWYLLLHE